MELGELEGNASLKGLEKFSSRIIKKRDQREEKNIH